MTGRYQVYEEFTSTNEAIIEDFPKHWDLTRIKFNSLVKARVGWHGLKSDDFTEIGPYLVTGSDFKGKYIQWRDCYHCDEERYQQDSHIQLKNGDLLLTKDGTIGKVALVSDLDGKATLNSGVFVVRPLKDGEFTTKYYYWLLLSRSFTDFVDFYKTGSTILHLYQETFVNFKYALPPLAEQQKLANFLDHETAKIDALITKQEKLIELLKEKRQSAISHAVTRGLNPNAPMKDSGVEWLGEVPEHWGICLIKHKCDEITDGAHISPEIKEGEHYFVSIKDIKSGVINFNDALLTSSSSYQYMIKTGCKPNAGDILFSKDGTIGETAITPPETDFVVASSLIIIRPQRDKVIPQFLDFVLQSSLVKEQVEGFVKGAALRRLSIQNLLKVFGTFPPKKEQAEIVEFILMQLDKFTILGASSLKQVELLKERKTALISAAVTGKIDVRDYEVVTNG
jgi:type I restriction enzyme S subunit